MNNISSIKIFNIFLMKFFLLMSAKIFNFVYAFSLYQKF